MDTQKCQGGPLRDQERDPWFDPSSLSCQCAWSRCRGPCRSRRRELWSNKEAQASRPLTLYRVLIPVVVEPYPPLPHRESRQGLSGATFAQRQGSWRQGQSLPAFFISAFVSKDARRARRSRVRRARKVSTQTQAHDLKAGPKLITHLESTRSHLRT